MASSREFVNYVREQLSGRDDVVIRPMMGEYLVYWGGKVGVTSVTTGCSLNRFRQLCGCCPMPLWNRPILERRI